MKDVVAVLCCGLALVSLGGCPDDDTGGLDGPSSASSTSSSTTSGMNSGGGGNGGTMEKPGGGGSGGTPGTGGTGGTGGIGGMPGTGGGVPGCTAVDVPVRSQAFTEACDNHADCASSHCCDPTVGGPGCMDPGNACSCRRVRPGDSCMGAVVGDGSIDSICAEDMDCASAYCDPEICACAS